MWIFWKFYFENVNSNFRFGIFRAFIFQSIQFVSTLIFPNHPSPLVPLVWDVLKKEKSCICETQRCQIQSLKTKSTVTSTTFSKRRRRRKSCIKKWITSIILNAKIRIFQVIPNYSAASSLLLYQKSKPLVKKTTFENKQTH